MARKPHTHHYIYKTTCKVNDKFYIGMHSTSNLEDGYIGSGKRLWNSIKKHGRENHEIVILEWFPDRSSLKEREKELVNESLLQDPMCMNLALGGDGGYRGEDAHRKWSSAGGKKRKGKTTPWVSEILKKQHLDGIIKAPDWTGRVHRQETKDKIGIACSISQKGEKNSQFGMKWIHNLLLKENKRIKREEEIPSGWNLGRKMKF